MIQALVILSLGLVTPTPSIQSVDVGGHVYVNIVCTRLASEVYAPFEHGDGLHVVKESPWDGERFIIELEAITPGLWQFDILPGAWSCGGVTPERQMQSETQSAYVFVTPEPTPLLFVGMLCAFISIRVPQRHALQPD